jgi:hypothetical protein
MDKLETVIKESEEALEKMIIERNSKPVSSLRSNVEQKAKYEKIIEANCAYLDKIINLNDSIDKDIETIKNLKEKLIKETIDRKNIYEQYYHNLMQFQKLVEEQTRVSFINARNIDITKTLMSVLVAFGKDMYNPYEFSPQTLLADPILKKAEELENIAKEKQAKLEQKAAMEENNIRKRLKHFKSRTQSHFLIPNLESHSTSSLKEKIAVVPTISFESKEEIFNGLSLALELSGYTIGHDNRIHTEQKRVFDIIMQGISTCAHEQVDSMTRYLNESIMKTRILSNKILVKEKANIGLQAYPLNRADAEVQLEDPKSLSKRKD